MADFDKALTRQIHARPRISAPMLCVAALLLSACDPKQGTAPELADTQSVNIETDTQALAEAAKRAWQSGATKAAAAQQAVQQLNLAVDTFLSDPTEITLAEARDSWHESHETILQLQPFFTLGRINPGLFGQLQQAHYQIDAWPIEPGYLDYFDVYQHSGIVNDIALPINADAIRQQHGFSSDTDVALGMHAIAYLLWGENLRRPASDFITQAPTNSERQSGLDGADLPTRRRGALLKLQLTLLADEVKALHLKLSHNASGLNSIYDRLPPHSQQQLWQKVVIDMLEQQLIGEQLAPRVSQEAEIYQHQQFSGRQGRALSASLRSIESLIFSDGNAQAHWLNPAQTSVELQQNFQSVHQALEQAEKDWDELEQDRLLELQQQLQSLAQSLKSQPAATTSNSAAPLEN